MKSSYPKYMLFMLSFYRAVFIISSSLWTGTYRLTLGKSVLKWLLLHDFRLQPTHPLRETRHSYGKWIASLWWISNTVCRWCNKAIKCTVCILQSAEGTVTSLPSVCKLSTQPRLAINYWGLSKCFTNEVIFWVVTLLVLPAPSPLNWNCRSVK